MTDSSARSSFYSGVTGMVMQAAAVRATKGLHSGQTGLKVARFGQRQSC